MGFQKVSRSLSGSGKEAIFSAQKRFLVIYLSRKTSNSRQGQRIFFWILISVSDRKSSIHHSYTRLWRLFLVNQKNKSLLESLESSFRRVNKQEAFLSRKNYPSPELDQGRQKVFESLVRAGKGQFSFFKNPAPVLGKLDNVKLVLKRIIFFFMLGAYPVDVLFSSSKKSFTWSSSDRQKQEKAFLFLACSQILKAS